MIYLLLAGYIALVVFTYRMFREMDQDYNDLINQHDN